MTRRRRLSSSGRIEFSSRNWRRRRISIYRKLNAMGPVTISVFRDIMHSGLDYTENIRHLLIDRVFSVIDTRTVLQLPADQWIEGLSIILRGTLDERIKFAYAVYDQMRTNRIKKEQVFPMMRGCLIKLESEEDPDESVRDLIEMMLKTLDVDRDGRVDEEEFKIIVKRDPLFLECMGPVFPSREAQHAFLTTFTHRLGDL
ncbi:EF-hand calcium-binding domain-containing protein 1 isoform X2 [Fopius arisanus]|uniref:EF-hand calcium-binding domain-containing protein 1 isoform X2 n=1 Tax=Fopius arisanus TaxID=64838 RepID=A0A9R1UBQ3_9HYME|nr:PREDICTED: EF-hand calcium-binding domain-containing protein 1-like isoform X2 [Fopius arisanus]